MAGMLTSLSILPSHDSRAILPEITVPTLVLIGEDDDETPPSYSKAIVDLMPSATLVTIPGAGNLLNLEAPDAVNRAILQHWETT
jgi:pimeloyl-ACP methyl ester carboxylesterase